MTSLIPATHNLFVVDLHYLVPLVEIEPLIEVHVDFLDRNYAAGRFIASGPKVPRTDGVILAVSDSREALEERLAEDPFHQRGVARYTITEFRPSKRAAQLDG